MLLVAASISSAADWGPFNAEFPAASDGLVKRHARETPFLRDGGFALSGWFKPAGHGIGTVMLAGIDGAGALCSIDGLLAYCGAGTQVRTSTALPVGAWTHVAASYDGRNLVLLAGGREVARPSR